MRSKSLNGPLFKRDRKVVEGFFEVSFMLRHMGDVETHRARNLEHNITWLLGYSPWDQVSSKTNYP